MIRNTMFIYYYEEENVFTKDDGRVIFNIFDIITPNDLYLFRYDPSFSCFSMKDNRNILVDIISVPEEVCGWIEIPDIDLGDDWERIERYERAGGANGLYIGI